MDEAAAVRRAALGAVGDVTPDRLRDDIETVVADGSLLPGVLALATADAANAVGDDLADRAAGVQLIYDGLRLTRSLAHDDPWADGATDAVIADANTDILAADVLVARGFYLLADTDVSADAVAVVRAFGRDQTDRRGAPDPEQFDRELEADVVRLALATGATAAGVRPTDADSLVVDLVDAWDGQFSDQADVVDARFRERLEAVAVGAGRPLNRND